MQEEWYVEIEGTRTGPHSRQFVENLRKAGHIGEGSRVWREGIADGVPYSQAGLNSRLFDDVSDAPAASRLSPFSRPGHEPKTMYAWNLSAHDTGPAHTSPDRDEQTLREIFAQRYRPGHADAARSDSGLPSMPPLEVEDDGWQWIKPAPWRRYLARTLDVLTLGSLVWMSITLIVASLSKSAFEILFAHGGVASMPLVISVVTMACLVPLHALLIGTCGMTLGKWLFGVRITRRNGNAMGIRAAMRRELHVFGSGLAAGIPLLAFFTMLIAYNVLSKTSVATWDRDRDWVVTQREPGHVQTAMCAFGVCLWILLLAWLTYLRKGAGV